MDGSRFDSQKIAIVGSSGFVGSYLTKELSKQGFNITEIVRQKGCESGVAKVVAIGDVLMRRNFKGIFDGIETIIYAIGRTHKTNEEGADFERSYIDLNCDATIRLATAARLQGVKRFIFLSSLKALGEETLPGKPFRHNSSPRPTGPYGKSKLLAEKRLMDLGKSTGLEVVIIRPPLIYGESVKGNLETLQTAMRLKIPLPLGGVSKNARSLVSLENLSSLIRECILNPAAANQVFMVKDETDLSTLGIIQLLAKNGGYTPILFKVPEGFLRFLFKALGKDKLSQRLLGNLIVDDNRTKLTLGWQPSSTQGSNELLDVKK